MLPRQTRAPAPLSGVLGTEVQTSRASFSQNEGSCMQTPPSWCEYSSFPFKSPLTVKGSSFPPRCLLVTGFLAAESNTLTLGIILGKKILKKVKDLTFKKKVLC